MSAIANFVLPLELLEKCMGNKIWIITKAKKELVGILRGFDDYLSNHFFNRRHDPCPRQAIVHLHPHHSEYDVKGEAKVTELGSLLFNGGQIVMVRVGLSLDCPGLCA
eukprot:TRINITY_DN5086_c0_g1_i4.p1 TRINITY_DN5086_c0_g1~~TRINITY_DN5086_c0_g1_i4.p1  ORF type:complete len:108 (+),score=11.11 TRINITY_DN5086_c0_g1_i4:81-404(+)